MKKKEAKKVLKPVAKKVAKADKPKVVKKDKKEKVKKPVENFSEPEEKIEAEPNEPKEKMVYCEGIKVIEVLSDGGNEKEYHCKMDNGTTMMVPKELFLKSEGEK